MRSKMTILILGLLALFFAACRTTATAPVSAQTSTVLQPGQSHEDCIELTESNVLTYTFTSSAPVDFNIHYHEGDKVTYPVQKSNITSDTGSFTPDRKAVYCLMWTNNGTEPANISYTSHAVPK